MPAERPAAPDFFARLLETYGELALLIDAKGLIEAAWCSRQSAADRASSLLGRKFEDLAGRGAWEKLRALAERNGPLGPPDGIEYDVRLEDGLHWFNARVVSLARAGRKPALCVMVRDVTHRRKLIQRLRSSALLLEQAEELANLGSWEYDPETGKVSVSENLLKIYGVASAEEWTRDVYVGRLHPDDRKRVEELGGQPVAERRPFEYVARYLAPDGRTRVLSVRAVAIQGAEGRADRGIGVVQDVTGLARAGDDLHRLSQQLLSLRDQDRREMARDLHDGVGQSLAALKMVLGDLREMLAEDDEHARVLLQSGVDLAEEAIREVRTVSYLMHPPLLDEAGLGPALRWYAQGFSERSGIATNVEIAEDFERCSQEIETTIFRIVQEALTNVHRYSGSERAEIFVTRAQGRIRAEVRDYGCGLPSPGALVGSDTPLGVGVAGMRERVKQLNGTFEMQSMPGAGTVVRVVLPDAPRKSRAPAPRKN